MRLAQRTRQSTALALAFLLCLGSVRAGITVTGTDGITATGTDGIQYVGTSGITATGTDSYLIFAPNGITATGTDGITATGTDGITATGTDGVTYTGANGIVATGADSMTITRADGITATGTDGITVTGTDGTRYQADSILIRQADGITATGTDGITATGTDGITATGTDTHQIARADGITATGTDGLTINGASGITATGTDGTIFSIPPTGITVTGTDGITATGTDGITVTGTDTFIEKTSDGVTATGTDAGQRGIRSIDPEFAILLNEMTDDSNVNSIVVYHRKPTETDLADLRNIGVLGGTRYRELPIIALTAKRSQIISISRLPAVRSIYGNRTLQPTVDPYLAMTGTERVRRDTDLTKKNIGIPVTGRGVTVAVLDTGLDGSHADLTGRVLQNVKLADTQSLGVGFTDPISVEGLQSTDQAYGHGTFVAGLIAGSGVRSGGKYGGVAPGANLVGLSAGDLNLTYVLSGFDYLLSKGAGLNTRVVNCSFSANTVFDTNDPVNVATKMLTDRGVSVVFSAGNTGSGQHTLNPYAVAPWVISVGATDERGYLANFSSRGDMGSALFRPTLVAPGVNVVSLRSTGASVTGTVGVIEADKNRLSPAELPFYTTASGTSFSAPQVAGTIALMLEANPRLTPSQIRDILQRTATPLPTYFQHEVGAGMLNAHAAVLESAFPERRMGVFRATLDQGQVSFITDVTGQFNGFVSPLGSYKVNVNVPADAVLTSVQAAWGPLSSTSDLALTVADASGTKLTGPNTPNQPGLTGKREGYSLRGAGGGTLRLQLSQAIGAGQPALGVVEVTRAEYAPLSDVGALSTGARADIQGILRTYTMLPYGKHFRPGFGVTRSDLAAALVRAGRVPQYLPGRPTFTDVSDATTMLFVESAQSAPGGALFSDVQPGGKFRPDDYATRLAAAVALVRAAGLQAEANAASSLPLSVKDASEIPASLRGYVAVALDKGLLTAEDGYFHAQSAITRAQLAHAMLLTWQKVN
ncbi:MAG TPA: S8 family serine peptidase [Pyrinomonadaceae bacterium]|nr:S8 family serine peptidase [Pyrinomonadaceae bacterium]